MRKCVGTILFLVFGCGAMVYAANAPWASGSQWLKWNKQTRFVYLLGYMTGYGHGFKGGCDAGQKIYSKGETKGLPGEECIPKSDEHSQKIEKYSETITQYYQFNPDDRNVPVWKVFDGLSDKRKLTIKQMKGWGKGFRAPPEQ